MVRAAGRILKGKDVQLVGVFTLDITQPETSKPAQTGTALVEPQVNIVENNPEYAVIEVVCSCGTKMSLRCEYTGKKASVNPQTDAKGPEVSEAAPKQTE
ncbi:MAG: hypothetical protein PVH77_01185 [Phycisphaerales bacterium]|jgi:hypothetical protein